MDGRLAPVLELETLSLAVGECVLVAGDPGHGHTALALVATGRMTPTSGSVEMFDDEGLVSTSASSLRRVTAVVDLPGVSEPDDVVPLGTVVAEELAYAHLATRRSKRNPWLESRGLLERRTDRMEQVLGGDRTEVLATLAAQRPDVRFLVITLPDRHGGDPRRWWTLAQELAGSGFGVLVQCLRATARDLGAALPPARGAEALRREPVEALRVVVPPGAGTQQGGVGDPPAQEDDQPTQRLGQVVDDGGDSPRTEGDR